VTRKRPTWICDTLNIYGIDEPYHEEEKMDPPVVRKVEPPSTISEGDKF
jgi:hypothetical protein